MPRYTLHIERPARDDQAILVLRDLLSRTLRREIRVTDADDWTETVTGTCALADLDGPVLLDGEHVHACFGALVSRGIGRRVCEAHAALRHEQIEAGLRLIGEGAVGPAGVLVR